MVSGQQVRLFVSFGESSPSARGHESAGNFLNDIWLLDLQTKTWTNMWDSNNPAGRGWFNAVAIRRQSAIVFG